LDVRRPETQIPGNGKTAPQPSQSRRCQEEAGWAEELLRRLEAGSKPWLPEVKEDVLPRISASLKKTVRILEFLT
jgi:hypothetical protein